MPRFSLKNPCTKVHQKESLIPDFLNLLFWPVFRLQFTSDDLFVFIYTHNITIFLLLSFVFFIIEPTWRERMKRTEQFI